MHPHRKLRSLVLLLLLSLLPVLLSPAIAKSESAHVFSLPDIGSDSINALISIEEEYALGRALLKQLRSQLPISQDLTTSAYLEDLGTQLLGFAPGIEFPFTFLLADDASINAFATPGGIIVVNTGLVEAAQNESELASVLAHEIAHVSQRHIARFYAKAGKWSLSTTIGMLAAILAAAYSPEAAQAALLTGIAANASAQLSFTREHETEADRVGKVILSNAGFDPSAMSRFFGRLQDSSMGKEDKAVEFLRTHPHPVSRIADSLDITPPGGEEGIKDSLAFQIFKAKVVASRHRLNGANTTLNDKDLALYLNAASASLNQYPEQTLKSIKQLSPAWQNLPQVKLLRSESLLQQNRYSESIALLRQLNANFPESPPILDLLARTYLLDDHPEHAYQLLSGNDGLLNRWPSLLKLKADAAANSGKSVQSHIALASYYENFGNIPQAIIQIDHALRSPNLSPDSLAKLEQIKTDLRQAQENLSEL